MPHAWWIGLALAATLVTDVRAILSRGDTAEAERLVSEYRSRNGLTPEMVEAHSWLGRGALTVRNYDQADAYAQETQRLVKKLQRTHPLESEPKLVTALGASIEVRGQAAAARGERDLAVAYLRQELKKYPPSALRARIQKNLHLLSLEGKPAPGFTSLEWLGSERASAQSMKGKPVLLFLWAHWCSDCKKQAALIAKVREEFAPSGLMVITPTRRYGYAESGREVPPGEELEYIRAIRRQHYAALNDLPAPVSEDVFNAYGVSTTPTLAVIARNGNVVLYHPGQATYETLASAIRKAL